MRVLPAEGVPGPAVEPVEEVVEAVLDHVGRGAVVEPGVELVDDTLEPGAGGHRLVVEQQGGRGGEQICRELHKEIER